VKLAKFGDKRSDKASLRNDANVMEIAGIEGDYDAGEISLADAVKRLERHHIHAVVVSTPSSTQESPRWRVFAPLAQPTTPDARHRLTARLNGALGGVLAGESFTLSQAYFFGQVDGVKQQRAVTFDGEDGQCIDELDNLDPIAIGRPSRSGLGTGEVSQLDRPLRKGDGRRELLKSQAARLINTEPDIAGVKQQLRELAAQQFDPSDPVDWPNIDAMVCDLKATHDRKVAENAALVVGLIGPVQRSEPLLNITAKRGAPMGSTSDDCPHISEVNVWRADKAAVVPPQLLQMPHPLLRKVEDVIARSAEVTDKALNIAGVIHLAACTVARAVESDRDNHAALFLGIVARTGAGKNSSKNFAARAIKAAIRADVAREFCSGSALFSLLRRSPSAVLHLDEFGDKLAHGLKDRAGSHLAKGFSDLKEIFSQTGDQFNPAAYSMTTLSDKERASAEQTLQPVMRPHLNIFAVTTPGQLSAAITDASVEGGLINRFLFVSASGLLTENEYFDKVVPDWLIEHMRLAHAGVGTERQKGNLSHLHLGAQDPNAIPQMRKHLFTEESMAVLGAFKDEIKRLGGNDEFMADISQRWRENAMRIALTLHSFSQPGEINIAPDITHWCIAYVRFYGMQFARRLLELAAPSEHYGKRRQQYLLAFRSSPEGVTSHDLGKRAPWRNDPPSLRTSIVNDMLAAGEIVIARGDKPARGPVPRFFVAVA
jgi:hypothetical protein